MAVSAVNSEPAEAAAPPKPSGKKGLIKLALIGVLVLGAAGGGYWYWSHRAHEEPSEAKKEAPKPPVFMPLETFTVNLQLVDSAQFLQTGITLKVADEKVVEEIKLQMPVVRDRILILMSSRKASDLLTVDGKRQLGEEIVASVNAILAQAAGKPVPEAKGADAKDAKDAAPAEEEKDAAEAKDAADKEPKDAKTAGKKAEDGAEQPVQSVLFTSFIIQ